LRWLVARATAVALATLAAVTFVGPADAFVYWTETAIGTTGRANLDGSGVNLTFISGLDRPQGMAIDSAHIYWVTGLGTIGRANLDGTASMEPSSSAPWVPKGWRSTALTSTGRTAGPTETGSDARTLTAPVSILASSQLLSRPPAWRSMPPMSTGPTAESTRSGGPTWTEPAPIRFSSWGPRIPKG